MATLTTRSLPSTYKAKWLDKSCLIIEQNQTFKSR